MTCFLSFHVGLLTSTSSHWFFLNIYPVQWLKSYSWVQWLKSYSWVQWLKAYSWVQWLKAYSRVQWLKSYSWVQWLKSYSWVQWLKSYSWVQWLKSYSWVQWLKSYSWVQWLKSYSWVQWLKSYSWVQWLKSYSWVQWLKSYSWVQVVISLFLHFVLVGTIDLHLLAWCILFIMSCFLIFASSLLISLRFQFIILKLYVTIGNARVLNAIIMFLALCSVFIMDLIRFRHSFLIFSFIFECCMPSPSSIPKYLYTSPGSRSFIVVFISSWTFCHVVSFSLMKVALAHFSSPKSMLISSLNFLTVLRMPVCSLSFFANVFRSSIYSRWLTFFSAFVSWPYPVSLRSVDSGAKAKQNRSGDSESPWKIPLLMLYSLDSSLPSWWYKITEVFRFSMLSFRKLIAIGEIL